MILPALIPSAAPALVFAGVLESFGELHWAIKLIIVLVIGFFALIFLLAFIKELIVSLVRESIIGGGYTLIKRLLGDLKEEGDSPLQGSAGPGVATGPSPREIADRAISRSKETVAVKRKLLELKKLDPNFSEARFRDLASTAFMTLHEAIEQKNLAAMRAWVTPSLLARLVLQVEELRDQGRTRRIEALSIKGVEIVDAEHDGPYFYLTVKIDASMRDFTLDDETGELTSGRQGERRSGHEWTFLRSETVKTPKEGRALVSSKCPNCGASIEINAAGRCAYCGSEVSTGAFSWVLSETAEGG